MKHDDHKRGYQYGPCSKRKPQLGPAVIEISPDVRVRRHGQDNLYFIEVREYGVSGWYRYGSDSLLESQYDAESRARDVAGL